MKLVQTFSATIYVGTRVVESDDWTEDKIHSLDDVKSAAQAYCNEVGLCVSVTATEFIYTHGREPGAIVGLINYPRFPSSPDEIRGHALVLAERLRTVMQQYQVSVVFPDETAMIGGETE